ncbi:hypothetical protein C8Q78DRAFT_994413 [Trametes maxima]|nr:hypothetical protein C8Q78DRAFT_994413 [Trametes maxima]
MSLAVSYLDALQNVLRDLATHWLPSITYAELLTRVVAHEHKQDFVPVGSADLILPLLDVEVKNRRIVVSGSGVAQMIMLTLDGVAHYSKRDQAGHSSNADVGHNTGIRTLKKRQAIAEYVRSAEVLAEVVGILSGHEPEILLRDVRRLPELVRENINSVAYIEEENQGILDQINQTHSRLDAGMRGAL